MNAKKGSLAIALICMLLAFMLTWQFRSVTALGGITNNTAKVRADQLQSQLILEQQKSEALYKQIIEYQEQLHAFSEEAQRSGGYAAILSQQLETALILAGQTAVKGPGITVKMTDSTRSNITGMDESSFIIHDEDILKVVNELRDAGAEALSLNGERLLATSEIRCAGSIVSVNNNRYAAPYTIQAIGNADELYNALTMRGGVVDALALWGIQCDISKSSNLVIEGYAGAIDYKYAVPVKSESDGGGS